MLDLVFEFEDNAVPLKQCLQLDESLKKVQLVLIFESAILLYKNSQLNPIFCCSKLSQGCYWAVSKVIQ